MTPKDGRQRSNEALSWFFTSPDSRYELAEVVHLTQCSRVDIQNWVRRGIIVPDETTPGRRVYLPTTVATIMVAAYLRRQGVQANHAFGHANWIVEGALEWFADFKLTKGEMPKFEKDFRGYHAVYFVYEPLDPTPSEQGVELLPGVLRVHYLPRDELGAFFDLPPYPVVGVVALHWVLLGLAETAKDLKDRPGKRLPKQAEA